jgi:hypothetical protein
MRIILYRNFRSLLKIGAFLLMATRSYGDAILSLTFDDPNGVLAAYPEGISLADTRNMPSIGESIVASGIGGSGKVKVEAGEWVDDGGEPPKSVQLIEDSAMGTRAFVRLFRNKQVPGMRGDAIIIPSGTESSLASLSLLENGKVVLNGGLDMFFRYNEENPSQEELVPNLFSAGGDGIGLIVESDSGSIAVSLNDSKGETSFDSDLDGSADATGVKTSSVRAAPIDPEAPYHLAISFQTADNGVVTVKVFLRPGDGAIDTSEDTDLVAKGEFSIIASDSEKSLKKGEFTIGADSRSSPEQAVLDLAAFRIFKPAPKIFPDISGKE